MSEKEQQLHALISRVQFIRFQFHYHCDWRMVGVLKSLSL